MKTYKINGKTASFSIDVGTVKRVHGILKIDLSNPQQDVHGSPLLVVMQGLDLMTMVDVLYAVCAPGLPSVGVLVDDGGVDFAQKIDPALEELHDAFLAEWLDFFARLGRQEQARLIQTAMKVTTAAKARAMAAIGTMEAEFERNPEAFFATAMNSPA